MYFEFLLKSVVSFLFRWVNKAKNGVSHVADDVKCRVRRIAYSNNVTDHQQLMIFETGGFFQGKLKASIESLPESKILIY